jgi:hypothetical protein
VRFVDFLKATVVLSVGTASALGAIAVLGAGGNSETVLVLALVGWWVIAAAIGLRLGRRADTSPPIARLLAGAKATTALPEHRPGAILFNRLWPLIVFTVVAGALTSLAPQIPGIGSGFAVIWALSWRHQHAAVAAVEERDGVRFYVLRTSPFRPMELQRTPGFKALRPERMNGAAT